MDVAGDASADFGDVDVASNSRTAMFVALAVGAIVAALIVVLASLIDDEEGPVASSPLDGRIAPALVGETIDGASFDLDDWRGRWVVVNFFATWCPPCIQEHPELVAFSERHADGSRRIMSVVFSDETDAVREFIHDNGGSWPVLLDDDGSRSIDYAVVTVPESILVAPNGTVVGKILGGVTADQLDAIIDRIEGIEPPAAEDGS